MALKYVKVMVLCAAVVACAPAAPPVATPPSHLAKQLEGKTLTQKKKILLHACLKEAQWAPHSRRANHNLEYEALCEEMFHAME